MYETCILPFKTRLGVFILYLAFFGAIWLFYGLIWPFLLMTTWQPWPEWEQLEISLTQASNGCIIVWWTRVTCLAWSPLWWT